MTSKLPLRSIQQDGEAHHSDSAGCTAVCLTSSFGTIRLGSTRMLRGGQDNSSVEGFLIGIASSLSTHRTDLVLHGMRRMQGVDCKLFLIKTILRDELTDMCLASRNERTAPGQFRLRESPSKVSKFLLSLHRAFFLVLGSRSRNP